MHDADFTMIAAPGGRVLIMGTGAFHPHPGDPLVFQRDGREYHYRCLKVEEGVGPGGSWIAYADVEGSDG